MFVSEQERDAIQRSLTPTTFHCHYRLLTVSKQHTFRHSFVCQKPIISVEFCHPQKQYNVTFLACNSGLAVYAKHLTDPGQAWVVLSHMPEVQVLYLFREKGYRFKFFVVFFRHLKRSSWYFKLRSDISGPFAFPCRLTFFYFQDLYSQQLRA